MPAPNIVAIKSFAKRIAALLGIGGGIGLVITTLKPIYRGIDMLSNIDFVRGNWESITTFFDSGFGTLTTVLLGTAIIGVSIYRGLRREKISPSTAVPSQPTTQVHSGPTFFPPTVTASPPTLRNSLYVCDIRFTFTDLEKDRHSELTMRVFNGSGRVVELLGLSGKIKFNAPNNTDPSRIGELPTPAVRPDTERTVVQLKEWFLILTQRVPAVEADKLLAVLKADIRILFDLSELNISVFAQHDRTTVEQLSIWSGVSYRRGSGFGRIVSASINLTIGAQSDVTRQTS